MKWARTALFWMHLVAGLVAGVVVVVMSVSGILLTYQRQVQLWADTRGIEATAAAAAGADRDAGADAGADDQLAPAALIDAAGTARDGTPTAIRWRSGQDGLVEVVYGREGSVWLDARAGAVLGTGSEATRAFFRSVTDWHRWLGRTGDQRDTGRAITGAANLLFLFIVLSGFWLWWPRRWTRVAFRNVTAFRRGLTAKARDFNWHNVIGLWSLVPLTIIIASGVVISYPWAGNLVKRLTAEEPAPARVAPARVAPTMVAPTMVAPAIAEPVGATPGTAPASPAVRPGRPAAATSAETPSGERGWPATTTVLSAASRHAADWRIATLQLAPAQGGVTLVVDLGDGGQPHRQATLVIEPASGAVVSRESFADGSPDRRARSILRFAHTGEVLGVPGQTIAGMATLGSLVLVWTGFALALRRLIAWSRRRFWPAGGDAREAAARDRDELGARVGP